MVIFGTKGGEKNRGQGVFHCPQCRSDQRYLHKEIVRKGHVYFIPLVNLGSVGEFIECQQCGGQFTIEVLNLPTRENIDHMFHEAIRGVAAAMIRADSVESEPEKAAGRYVVRGLTGQPLSEAEQKADLSGHNQADVRSTLTALAPNLTEQGKVQILQACVLVAASDGVIAPSELETLRGFCRALEVPTQYLLGIVQSVVETDEGK